MDITEIEVQKKEVSRAKVAINNAIPIGTDIAVIIIALAELQRDMAELLYEYADDDSLMKTGSEL